MNQLNQSLFSKINLNKFIVTFILILTASSATWAQQVEIGQITLSGRGCPPGTASVTLSPDSSVASILFSSFSIVKDSNTNQAGRTLSVTCTVILPIKVPDNYVLVSWNIDYRGYVHIEDTMAGFIFTSSPQLTSAQRWGYPVQKTSYGGIRDEEVAFSHNVRTLTGCGSQVNLQVDMNMVVTTQQGMHQMPIRGNVMASMDSADQSVGQASSDRGMKFKFGLIPCR